MIGKGVEKQKELQAEKNDFIANLVKKQEKTQKVTHDSLIAVMREIQQNGQNLEGNRKYEVIRQKQSNDWIKSRKNAGLEILDKQRDIAFAKEIFNAWDVSKKRYLTF